MLAVLSRHKLLIAILLLILMAVLVWIYVAAQNGEKTYSKGTFVMERLVDDYCPERGCSIWSR